MQCGASVLFGIYRRSADMGRDVMDVTNRREAYQMWYTDMPRPIYYAGCRFGNSVGRAITYTYSFVGGPSPVLVV